MTTIEWVEESDWGKVARGAIVQLRHGDHFMQARNGHSDAESILMEFRDAHNIHSMRVYKNKGWSLYVEAKPAMKLPEAPGCYADKVGEFWYLSISGKWSFQGQQLDTAEDLSVADYAPFTRLEPVAETAKKVLDALKAEYEEDYIANSDPTWNLVAKQFGVTS